VHRPRPALVERGKDVMTASASDSMSVVFSLSHSHSHSCRLPRCEHEIQHVLVAGPVAIMTWAPNACNRVQSAFAVALLRFCARCCRPPAPHIERFCSAANLAWNEPSSPINRDSSHDVARPPSAPRQQLSGSSRHRLSCIACNGKACCFSHVRCSNGVSLQRSTRPCHCTRCNQDPLTEGFELARNDHDADTYSEDA
jgi:hypothetical protein